MLCIYTASSCSVLPLGSLTLKHKIVTSAKQKNVFILRVPVCLLALEAPISSKVDCSSRLLKCLRSLYDKQKIESNDRDPRLRIFEICLVMSPDLCLLSYFEKCVNNHKLYIKPRRY